MDRWIVGWIWFLSLMISGFYAHEFGIMKGEHYSKVELSYKLENCNKQLAGIQ